MYTNLLHISLETRQGSKTVDSKLRPTRGVADSELEKA